jgi:hypothetical protein
VSEATERFFESLPARAPAVLRTPITGTLQIDLSTGNRTDHWLVQMRPGEAVVTHARGTADAVWHSSGRTQAIAAVLRNESTFSGNVVLFLAFRRFLPSPPGTRDPREVAREQVGRAP